MSAHYYDPASSFCDGCGISMAEVADKAGAAFPSGKERYPGIEICPAFRMAFNDGGETVAIVITPKEEMTITSRAGGLRLSSAGMFNLRDAIEDGVRQIREKRS